jgi:hypothetical protein
VLLFRKASLLKSSAAVTPGRRTIEKGAECCLGVGTRVGTAPVAQGGQPILNRLEPSRGIRRSPGTQDRGDDDSGIVITPESDRYASRILMTAPAVLAGATAC